MKRLIVLGAGPIGLEAALEADARGFDVTVLERERIGASLLRWGSTRFFTPVELNTSARMARVLAEEMPEGGALLTGVEFVEQVMRKAAARPPLLGKIRERCTVVGIGRARMTRKDMPRHPIRKERPFAVLADTPEGEVRFEAEFVLDATGSQTPAAVGAGGLFAEGERALTGEIIRYLGELDEKAEALEDKRILLVGNGHSAANAVLLFQRWAEAHPKTRVTWATRTINKRPLVAVADDPLPERQQIVDRANALAVDPPEFLTMERRAHVEAIQKGETGFEVRLSGDRTGTYDAVAAFTGYRPDVSMLSELQVELSPVTEGAAGIERALSNVTDCLSVPEIAAEDLASGESGFHVVGHKSYGRSSTFLLKDGIKQLETIIDGLHRRGE